MNCGGDLVTIRPPLEFARERLQPDSADCGIELTLGRYAHGSRERCEGDPRPVYRYKWGRHPLEDRHDHLICSRRYASVAGAAAR